VFVLAIFGIAYNTYSKQSIVGYWEFLALVICMVCIGSGWPHAHDKKARRAWSGRRRSIGSRSWSR
jgi:hypothetical protein